MVTTPDVTLGQVVERYLKFKEDLDQMAPKMAQSSKSPVIEEESPPN